MAGSIASIPTSKLKAHEEAQRAYEEFIARGGQPKKCPAASHTHTDRERLRAAMKPAPEPKPFSPKQEAKNLRKAAEEHEQKVRQHVLAKYSRGEVEDVDLPWRTDRSFLCAGGERPNARGKNR